MDAKWDKSPAHQEQRVQPQTIPDIPQRRTEEPKQVHERRKEIMLEGDDSGPGGEDDDEV